ncbi:MAG: DUF2254 domain-containing protein [Actinobacteria bacterium]|nr:DUF2254 domain-containing protein [Actinomycetota bacterium]
MARSSSRRARTDGDVARARIVQAIGSGFVIVPGSAVLAAIATSFVMSWVDREVGDHLPDFVFDGSSQVAQSVLTTIAASIMTMTSLVLSVTVVVLQLSSQQFSPRALQTFFRDRGTKAALGIFLSTFVYALMVLRSLEPSGGAADVPRVSMAVAIAMTLVSLGAFVYYVDHVVHAVQVVSIIEAVAVETRTTIAALQAVQCAPDGLVPPDRPPDLVVPSGLRPGVVTIYSMGDLLALARHHRCLIRMLPAVGQYVPFGVPLAEVWSDDGSTPTVTADEIGEAVGIEQERTMAQDPAFGLRQLVDIAEKALSPAVNDPTTASQCINRIHDLLRRLGTGPLPAGTRADDGGHLRVVVPALVWEDVVGLACNEIRRYGARSLQVQRRMRFMLSDLLTAVPEDRRPALERQVDLLDAVLARHVHDAEDREWAVDTSAQIDDG